MKKRKKEERYKWVKRGTGEEFLDRRGEGRRKMRGKRVKKNE